MGEVEVRILGPLEVQIGGTPVALGGAKQRAVLGALLLSPNEVVSVDRLVEAVWGGSPSPRAPHTLQVYVSKLRSALDPDRSSPSRLIESVSPGYVARITEESLDLLEFESLIQGARELAGVGSVEQAVDLYRQALKLWRGPLLSDLADHDFVGLESIRLDMARLTAHADCIDAELALGHHGEVLPEVSRLVRSNPLDERLRGQLMIALYRSGRHADALATYREVRLLLDEELGLEPGAELRLLEEKILLHDPVLLEPSVAPPGTTVTIDRTHKSFSPAWLELDDERFTMERAVTTIGRLPDRSIMVSDPTVSRRHAEIRRVGSRFALVDVGSMNGLTVNGRVVLEHDLHEGDVIQVGTAEFIFRTG